MVSVAASLGTVASSGVKNLGLNFISPKYRSLVCVSHTKRQARQTKPNQSKRGYTGKSRLPFSLQYGCGNLCSCTSLMKFWMQVLFQPPGVTMLLTCLQFSTAHLYLKHTVQIQIQYYTKHVCLHDVELIIWASYIQIVTQTDLLCSQVW